MQVACPSIGVALSGFVFSLHCVGKRDRLAVWRRKVSPLPRIAAALALRPADAGVTLAQGFKGFDHCRVVGLGIVRQPSRFRRLQRGTQGLGPFCCREGPGPHQAVGKR